MLAVQGPREDGFHALTSLVAPVVFGDRIRIRQSSTGSNHLRCDDPEVPIDENNLILQAALVFSERTRDSGCFEFELEKHIPMGAGLGGGSSDAAAALQGMNELVGMPLSQDALRELAAELGSDCPFFIEPRIALMRGRGEILEAAPPEIIDLFQGQGILLFKPPFGISTAWAYEALRRAPGQYVSESEAQARMHLTAEGARLSDLLYNSFEGIVGAKFLAIRTLLGQLRDRGIPCGLSGSGSCCFALIESGSGAAKTKDLKSIIESAWGESVFFIETALN